MGARTVKANMPLAARFLAGGVARLRLQVLSDQGESGPSQLPPAQRVSFAQRAQQSSLVATWWILSVQQQTASQPAAASDAASDTARIWSFCWDGTYPRRSFPG